MSLLKTLTFQEPEDYPSDIDRIVRVMRAEGYLVSRADARRAWEAYSESYSAGWLIMHDLSDDEVYGNVLRYLGPEE